MDGYICKVENVATKHYFWLEYGGTLFVDLIIETDNRKRGTQTQLVSTKLSADFSMRRPCGDYFPNRANKPLPWVVSLQTLVQLHIG